MARGRKLVGKRLSLYPCKREFRCPHASGCHDLGWPSGDGASGSPRV